MNLIKILGIGSSFGDDQAGWKVIEILKNKLLKQSDIYQNIELEYSDRPGSRLIELIKGFDNVYLIDAVKTGSDIGTICRLQNQEIEEYKNLMSTHHIGVAQALQLARALNELPKNIILYGIEIDNSELCSTLSKVVEQAVNQVVIELGNEINNISTASIFKD